MIAQPKFRHPCGARFVEEEEEEEADGGAIMKICRCSCPGFVLGVHGLAVLSMLSSPSQDYLPMQIAHPAHHLRSWDFLPYTSSIHTYYSLPRLTLHLALFAYFGLC